LLGGAGRLSQRLAAGQGAAQGQFIRVFEPAARGQAVGQPGHLHPVRRQALRQVMAGGVAFDVRRQGEDDLADALGGQARLEFADAQVIVMLGALLHDIGNAIHREHHQEHGVCYADRILDEILPEYYSDVKLHRLKLAVLGCVYEHDESVLATSLEAGVVKVADGTDCENGRARIPYKIFGKSDIHAVSALAIKNVLISEGKKKPVKIIIDMSNPAGLFQVDEVLGKKLKTSCIDEFFEVAPLINGKPFKTTDITML